MATLVRYSDRGTEEVWKDGRLQRITFVNGCMMRYVYHKDGSWDCYNEKGELLTPDHK